MTPFTVNTFITFIVIALFIGIFYYWDFDFHPVVNIILKSILVGLSYVLLVYRLNLSEDITAILEKWFKRQKN